MAEPTREDIFEVLDKIADHKRQMTELCEDFKEFCDEMKEKFDDAIRTINGDGS